MKNFYRVIDNEYLKLLKPLSSEIDPAEIRLIWEVVIKEKCAEGF